MLRNKMISVGWLLGTEAKCSKIKFSFLITFTNCMLGQKTSLELDPRLWLIMKMSEFHRLWHEVTHGVH